MNHEHSTLLNHADVARANARVTRTGVLDKFAVWKQVPIAGRPSLVSERALLVGLMLLAQERSPFSIASLATLLQHRLCDESRQLLGLPHLNTPESAHESKRWYNRTHTAFHRMVALMAPYPGSASATSFTGIRALLEDHNVAHETMMNARLDEFTQAFLQTGFAEQPRRLRRADPKIDLSIGQAFIPSPLSRGFSHRDLESGIAEKDMTGRPSSAFRPTEVFAGWSHLGEAEAGECRGQARGRANIGWGWTANIALRVDSENPTKPRFPALVVAATLTLPNVGVSKEAIRLMRASLSIGLTPGIVHADKAYFASEPIERLHLPTAETGFTYRSAEWEAFHHHARLTPEKFNADVHDLSTASNGAPSRPRVRGFAAAQVLTTIILTDYNRRITASYLRTEFRSQGNDSMPTSGSRPRSSANFENSANEPATDEHSA